ncbi:putative Bardet Biedl syndrome 5 protein [Trypanosoma vivax]|uniref:BBSome complex member BBS5 PH domain-containing protein n=1 Tax=Trypanosoma vivax (strain Y486) TaxID=1055687 RepID=G0TRH0_TRYVY|nr:hypothetical protein TRVL_05407 [Trypanosoma vivax]KAH8604011.1 putative Bardet Biedl syndrome 5 protein [Trypanosoma vivax]CCC46534.1 conserved hypothetical protein [Trypanosoma vivax Y486]
MLSSQGQTVHTVKGSAPLWLDREVRFDVHANDLEIFKSRGECLLATLKPVEDTKGNNGEEGVLFVTNLRCIWQSSHSRRTNLSIGYSGVHSMEVQLVNSRLRGNSEALRIGARYGSSRFEFIFTYILTTTRLFEILPAVWRAYDSSRIYREMRLRSSAIRDGELVLLEDEHLFTRLRGVSSVGVEGGYVGTFFTTNLRLAWCSQNKPEHNISIPLLQVSAIHLKQTKYDHSLVVQTFPTTTAYVVSFRVEPRERVTELYKECASLLKAFNSRPNLGIAVALTDAQKRGGGSGSSQQGSAGPTVEQEEDTMQTTTVPVPQSRVEDGENVVQKVETDAFAAYYADVGQKGADRRPEYNESVGLAVEKLRQGITLQELWAIVA